MQFEKFDDKVKQAAEQHHPNYDEKAWAKMEKLLNRHLPQENDRRRRIIFLVLLFLFVGGGAWIMMNKPWQQEKTVSLYTNDAPEKTTDPSSSGSAKKLTEAAGPGDLAQKKITSQQEELVKQPAIGTPFTADAGKANTLSSGSNKPVKDQKIVSVKNQVQKDSYQADIEPGSIAKTAKPGNDISNPGTIQKTGNNSPDNTIMAPSGNDKSEKVPEAKDKNQPEIVINDNKADNKSNLPAKDISDQHPAATVEKSVTKKNKGKKGNVFFLTASAGPDVSSVGMESPGKVELLAGAGFGYTFNGKWTVRTGFYTARKVYTAEKEAYKPSGTIPNYPYLDRINANCTVYEIPLTLAYNFGESKNGNWYASTGLSSYIMKKEVYQYVYNYLGQPSVYTKTVNNENKHYFSVLSLSAGYQRRINRTLSISAEPYIKVPLTGIGFGYVKLNSAGLLFSVNLSLFQPASVK